MPDSTTQFVVRAPASTSDLVRFVDQQRIDQDVCPAASGSFACFRSSDYTVLVRLVAQDLGPQPAVSSPGCESGSLVASRSASSARPRFARVRSSHTGFA